MTKSALFIAFLLTIFSWQINAHDLNFSDNRQKLNPSNDDCDNAIALTVNPDLACGTVTHATNVSATASSQADDVTGTPDDDVWFTFVATNDKHVISLLNVTIAAGDTEDMAMGLYDGSSGCSGLTLVTDSDPNAMTVTGLTVGTTYYLRVYGWGSGTSSAQTTFDVCVGTPPPPPSNDDCDNAIALTVNPDLACGTVTHATNVSATASDQTDDVTGTPNDDVWFTFVATNSKHRISLLNVTAVIGTATDMAMGLYDGSSGCSGLTLVADSDPDFFTATGLTVGTTYYLRVYSYFSSSSTVAKTTFDVCIGTPPSPPSNDDCDNAIALTVNPDLACGTVTHATNVSATASSQADDVVGTPNDDVWFTFVATNEKHVVSLLNITPVIGHSEDMAMGLYDGSSGCSGLTLVTDSDPDIFVATGLTVGTTYYLRIFSWGNSANSAQTTFDVCIGTPSPTTNDTCNTSKTLDLEESATCNSVIHVNNYSATDSGIAAPSCGSYHSESDNGDLWYVITIPTGVTEITLDVDNVIGLTSVAGALYSGDCSGLNEIDCTEYRSGWPWTISGLTSGDTYYLRIWDYGNDQFGSFDLCGRYTTATISDNHIEGFKYFPNPVNDVLNMTAKDNIEAVSVFGITGQEVIHITPNTLDAHIHINHLKNGIYFVKVQVNGQVTAFKIIKK